MRSATRVELIYSGPEVDDGTVAIEDLVVCLAGFDDAFVRVARFEGLPEPERRMRLVGLERGSARILIDVFDWVTVHPEAAKAVTEAAGMVGTAAYVVIKGILKIIEAKKGSRGQTTTNNISTTIKDSVIVNNVSLTKEQFELLRSGALDDDLARFAAPLKKGHGISRIRLRVDDEQVDVSSEDWRCFEETSSDVDERYAQMPIRKFKFLDENKPKFRIDNKCDERLEGSFASHTKRNNSGMFEMTDGTRLKYRYVGNDLESLLRAYVSHEIVKVFGTVKYGNATRASIQIRDVEPSPTNPALGQGSGA